MANLIINYFRPAFAFTRVEEYHIDKPVDQVKQELYPLLELDDIVLKAANLAGSFNRETGAFQLRPAITIYRSRYPQTTLGYLRGQLSAAGPGSTLISIKVKPLLSYSAVAAIALALSLFFLLHVAFIRFDTKNLAIGLVCGLVLFPISIGIAKSCNASMVDTFNRIAEQLNGKAK